MSYTRSCVRPGAARALLALLLLVAWQSSWAQIAAPPRPAEDYRNSVSAGLSIGEINGRDADFWGWTIDYNRSLTDRWTSALSLTWDRETENGTPDIKVTTYTLVGTVSYNLSERISLTTGIGKGVADDSNAQRRMRITDGDWSTGIAVGFALPGLPLFVRDSVVLSVAYEYNVSRKETSVSADLGIGWSF